MKLLSNEIDKVTQFYISKVNPPLPLARHASCKEAKLTKRPSRLHLSFLKSVGFVAAEIFGTVYHNTLTAPKLCLPSYIVSATSDHLGQASLQNGNTVFFLIFQPQEASPKTPLRHITCAQAPSTMQNTDGILDLFLRRRLNSTAGGRADREKPGADAVED